MTLKLCFCLPDRRFSHEIIYLQITQSTLCIYQMSCDITCLTLSDLDSMTLVLKMYPYSVAHPGFSKWRARQPLRGYQLLIDQFFPERWMEIKNFDREGASRDQEFRILCVLCIFHVFSCSVSSKTTYRHADRQAKLKRLLACMYVT